MDLLELQTIYENFVKELDASQKGKRTSLAFIENRVPQAPLVRVGEVFQVMTIGGTVFRSALVEKNAVGFRILREDVKGLPKFSTKEVFFGFLEDHLDHTIQVLALNFAYRVQPISENHKLDGILLEGSKGHLFEGLVGQRVGEEFERYMMETYHRLLSVIVANDAVCLTLSGLTQYPWGTIAGGIVGTGLNFSVMLNEKTVVSLESGAFDKFIPSPEGLMVDSFSSNKRAQLFEKEISGAYLYLHYNLKLRDMPSDIERIQRTEDLSRMAERDGRVGEIAKDVLERSAALAAAQIAGILSFLQRDLTFVMQGSLFWKGYHYKEMIEQYVKLLEPNYSVQFVSVEHADILGAAKLVA